MKKSVERLQQKTTIKIMITGCIYWPGKPTALTRPGGVGATLEAAAPAPEEERRPVRSLCRLRPVVLGGRYYCCWSGGFGSIIPGTGVCSIIFPS